MTFQVYMPGDFALTRISGITGRAVAAGQWVIGDGAPVQHAMIYVGEGLVVQAMPGGAEIVPLSEAADPVIWSWGTIPLTAAQRSAIVGEALRMVGTPYSFLDYASIALAHLGLRPRWLAGYVASTDHLICSQLVDLCYSRAGIDLFPDGRLAGDVTPGDLYRRLTHGCV